LQATRSWRFPVGPNIMIIRRKGQIRAAHRQRYQHLLEDDYSGLLMPCCEQL
jgi:hypothetical protein